MWTLLFAAANAQTFDLTWWPDTEVETSWEARVDGPASPRIVDGGWGERYEVAVHVQPIDDDRVRLEVAWSLADLGPRKTRKEMPDSLRRKLRGLDRQTRVDALQCGRTEACRLEVGGEVPMGHNEGGTVYAVWGIGLVLDPRT